MLVWVDIDSAASLEVDVLDGIEVAVDVLPSAVLEVVV